MPVDAGVIGAGKSTSVFEFVKQMIVRMDLAKKAAREREQSKVLSVKQEDTMKVVRRRVLRLEAR